MSAGPRRPEAPGLLVCVCGAPLLAEAVAVGLDGIAEVRAIPPQRDDLSGLLGWLDPDAVVVDSEADADAAAAFTDRRNTPLVHVSLDRSRLRVRHGGGWRSLDEEASPASIRNVLVGAMLGRTEDR